MPATCEIFFDPLEEVRFDRIIQAHFLEVFFPILVLAQISIGIYYAQEAKSTIKKHLSAKRHSNLKLSKGDTFTNLIGSPENSVLSMAAYYLAGACGVERLAFITQELYECLQQPMPYHQKNYISVNKTIIPYFYPHFKSYKVKNNSYRRCHEAVYESASAASLLNVSNFLLHRSLIGAFVQYDKHYFIKNCQITLNSAQKQACINFQVAIYLSKKQISVDSQPQTTFQLTLPRHEECFANTNSFSAIFDLITKIQPERIVIHQKRALLQTHQNVLMFALEMQTFLYPDNKELRLISLAYHNENPVDPIPEFATFYCVFSEICTIGYNNPNNAFKEISSENLTMTHPHDNKNYLFESQERCVNTISHWKSTTILHANLKKPLFKWEFLQNTLLALILHEVLFKACHCTTESMNKAIKSKKLLDIAKAFLASAGLLSTQKWLLHLLFLPIRMSLIASGACYLYATDNSQSIFDLRSRPSRKKRIQVDSFSTKEAQERILIYEKFQDPCLLSRTTQSNTIKIKNSIDN